MSELHAYEILVHEHATMVTAYVRGIVGDAALAQDIAQEAFIRGHRYLARFKPGSSFAAWIRAIARNLAIDELKRRKREVPLDPDIIQGMEDILQPFDDPSRGESWKDRVQTVEGCFRSLPDTLREPCRLYYYEDNDTNRIAETLRISAEAVRKRLERARDLIKTCIEKALALERPSYG
jgi:RNA polymerase sigma-70 factor (ECF subfamily)